MSFRVFIELFTVMMFLLIYQRKHKIMHIIHSKFYLMKIWQII